MKVKIIGSKLCEDTREALKKLEVMAADYEFVDIMGSMDNLSMFLGIRDTDENYIPVKERGGVGVPYFIFEDGTKTLDADEAFALLAK